MPHGRQPAVAHQPQCGPLGYQAYPPLLFASLLLFFLMWSTPPHWLQHMPVLARPYPKTSNTHNFWTVAPKIMKFALTRSLFWDASFQKVSKNQKIVRGHTTLTKTGLVTPSIYGPLGVNKHIYNILSIPKQLCLLFVNIISFLCSFIIYFLNITPIIYLMSNQYQ
jgi:uncharacterized protein with PQ loop repeat